jgi:hypothetical protein
MIKNKETHGFLMILPFKETHSFLKILPYDTSF